MLTQNTIACENNFHDALAEILEDPDGLGPEWQADEIRDVYAVTQNWLEENETKRARTRLVEAIIGTLELF